MGNDPSIRPGLGLQFSVTVLDSFRSTLEVRLAKFIENSEMWKVFWDADAAAEFFNQYSLEFKTKKSPQVGLGTKPEENSLIDDLDPEQNFQLEEHADWKAGLEVTVVKYQKETINDFLSTLEYICLFLESALELVAHTDQQMTTSKFSEIIKLLSLPKGNKIFIDELLPYPYFWVKIVHLVLKSNATLPNQNLLDSAQINSIRNSIDKFNATPTANDTALKTLREQIQYIQLYCFD